MYYSFSRCRKWGIYCKLICSIWGWQCCLSLFWPPLNLLLLSSSLNSHLEHLPKVLWFQDVHADKTFHTWRLKVKQNKTKQIPQQPNKKPKQPNKKSPNPEAARWRQLMMITPWLLLKDQYLQAPYPRRTLGSLLEEVLSAMTSCLSWRVWCWDCIMMTDEAVWSS